MKTTFLIARHAFTDWNEQGRIQGDSDTSKITQKGIRQCELLRKRLEREQIDSVYSSDLKRAIETAKLAVPGRKIIRERLLRERHFGKVEGLTMKELEKKDPLAMEHFRKTRNFPYPECETVEALKERATKAMEKILENNMGKTVLIFTHGAFIKAAVRAAMGERAPKNIWVSNCSLTTISHASRFKVEKIDDTKHLGKLVSYV